MDELLRELLHAPGVPGCEDRVRDLIRSRLPEDLRVETDALGNLVATLGEGSGGAMFVAHMDEIGFLVADVRDDGFLGLKALGGVDPRAFLGRVLRVVTANSEVAGVLGVKPPHLMTDRVREMAEVAPVAEMLLDIGARSREEAEALGVRVLDFAVPEKHPRKIGADLWCARALDDRLGCWVLLRAAERLVAMPRPPAPVRFAFSVQEEVGLRGASLLARSHELAYAFAVDSVSAADWPGVERKLGPAKLGAGPCLRVVDNASIVPLGFRRELEELAQGENIPLQVVFSGGGTDARPFQSEGPQVMPLCFPVRYTHSNVELAHAGDAQDLVRLVCAAAARYAR